MSKVRGLKEDREMARSTVGALMVVLIGCEFAIGQVTDKRWEFEVASVRPGLDEHGSLQHGRAERFYLTMHCL